MQHKKDLTKWYFIVVLISLFAVLIGVHSYNKNKKDIFCIENKRYSFTEYGAKLHSGKCKSADLKANLD